MASFATPPKGNTLTLTPFKAAAPDSALAELKQALKYSKIGPKTYENLREDGHWGVSHNFITEAKRVWEEEFDWRKVEDRINAFPNFTTIIETDDGNPLTIHFLALFSSRPDATPLILSHGWPGSILEFLDFLGLIQSKYPDPASLPYNVIVPSIPGYAFSSGPPLTRNFDVDDITSVFDKLMRGLGFGGGYIAQGGDIGSAVTWGLATQSDACKAIHLNFHFMDKRPEGLSADSENAAEQKGVERLTAFVTRGTGYAREHGTRPATIGLVLSSSPIALLAWIGEKFLEWSDTPPSINEILASVTLYWLTDSFPRAIYPYRHERARPTHQKPIGYSWFPMELDPIPKSWIETQGKLVWHRQHTEGGHFAAMEKPHLLLGDIEEYIAQIKQDASIKFE